MLRSALSRAAIAVLALGLVVAGCSEKEPGDALPGSTTESPPPATDGSEPSSTDAGPTVAIPPRPAELSLDGLQPCDLFTAAQLSELGIDRDPRPGTSDSQLKGPTCTLAVATTEPFYNYTAQLVTDLGVDTWLTGKRNVDAWLVSVGGYPAVNFKTKGVDDQECITTVDVADGQQLMIDLYPLSEVDYKQLCPMSEKAAAMALQTLQTLR